MRRLLLATVPLSLTWIGSADPAAACSCAAPPGPPPIEVEATAVDAVPAQTAILYTFRVDEVVSGDVADEVEVMIPEGDGGNCGINPVPDVGSTYRLATYPADAGGPFHVNLCSGSVELVAAGDPASVRSDEDDSPPYALYVAAVVLGLTAVGVVIARR